MIAIDEYQAPRPQKKASKKRMKRIMSLLRPLEQTYGVSNKTKDMIMQALREETISFNRSRMRNVSTLVYDEPRFMKINDFGIETKLKMIDYQSPGRQSPYRSHALTVITESRLPKIESMRELKPYSDQIEPVTMTGVSKLMAFEETREIIKSQSLISIGRHSDRSMHTKRRIHIDGVRMLDTHNQTQEMNEKFNALQNRVQRLQFEEQRAKQQAMLAERRQSEMISARQRHYEDLLYKKELCEIKLKQREEQRLANLEAKERHQQTLKHIRKFLINQNIEIRHKVQSTLEAGQSRLEMEKRQELDRKLAIRFQTLNRTKNGLDSKIQRKTEKLQKNSANYRERMMETKLRMLQLKAGISDLESREQSKLDSLKNTTQMQSKSLQRLYSTVESGHLYYLQAFKEKRELQDQWDARSNKSPESKPAVNKEKRKRVQGLLLVD